MSKQDWLAVLIRNQFSPDPFDAGTAYSADETGTFYKLFFCPKAVIQTESASFIKEINTDLKPYFTFF